MSESKTLFFFTEEWDNAATSDHLLTVINIVLTSEVTKEMQTSTIPNERWNTTMEIMHTKRFVDVISEYFQRIEEDSMHNPKHLKTVRELRLLIMLFIRQGMGEDTLTPAIAKRYFMLLADIMDFYETTYDFVVKRIETLEATGE